MPLARIVIKTQVWRKLLSLRKREKHQPLQHAMEHLGKVTFTPKNDTILWEPSKQFCEAAINALKEELTFQRKPDSASCNFMREVISGLEGLLKQYEQEKTQVQAGDLDAGTPNQDDPDKRGFDPK